MNDQDGVSLYSAAHPGSGSLWGRIKAFFTRSKLNPDSLEVIEIDNIYISGSGPPRRIWWSVHQDPTKWD